MPSDPKTTHKRQGPDAEKKGATKKLRKKSEVKTIMQTAPKASKKEETAPKDTKLLQPAFEGTKLPQPAAMLTKPPQPALTDEKVQDLAGFTLLLQRRDDETEAAHVYHVAFARVLTQVRTTDTRLLVCELHAKAMLARSRSIADIHIQLHYFKRNVELRRMDAEAARKANTERRTSQPTWADVVAAWGQPVADRVRRQSNACNFCANLVWFIKRGYDFATVANLLSTAIVQRIDNRRRPNQMAVLPTDVASAKTLPRDTPALAAADIRRVRGRLDSFGLLVPLSPDELTFQCFLNSVTEEKSRRAVVTDMNAT